MDGISFHGNFLTAIVLAIFFGIMLWIVEVVAVALSALFTISTAGLALLWIIPAWILGFWILPAVALKLLADLLPGYLAVEGWMPAIVGGLVMLGISLVTRMIPDHRRTRIVRERRL